MIYDIIPLLAGAFVIIFLILVRRGAQAGPKNPQRRSVRSGLVLERAREKSKSSLGGPVMIALPLIVIGAWLAASYFTPGDEPAASPAQTAATPAPPAPQDSAVMSGRIVIGQDSAPPDPANAPGSAPMAEAARNTAQNQGPGGAPAPSAPLTQAARAMLPAISRMEQVGLLPARGTANAAPRPMAQKPPATAAAPKPAAPKPAAANGQAAAQPKPAPKPAAAPTPERDGGEPALLGGGREFTVHLASFAERGNAEKYMGKLVTARVRDAFITESTINGRLWYRVMSGRFASQAEAEAHGADLRRRNLTASGGRYVIKSLP